MFLFCFDFSSVFARKNPLAVIKAFTHGLHIADLGGMPEIKTTYETAALSTAPKSPTA